MNEHFSYRFKLTDVFVDYITASGAFEQALSGVDLELIPGSWVAVVGHNGSGKSTLAKVLAGLCPLTSGTLHTTVSGWAHIVMQNPETQLLGETVREELLLACPNTDELAGFSGPMLDAQLRGYLNRAGLPIPLGSLVAPLSGGQKQLLNIACSLAAGADAIVFDEPTSMLDPASCTQVLDAVRSLHKQGVTVIWVTHRIEELAAADRVVVMNQGSPAYDGSVQRFFYGTEGPEAIAPCEQLGFVAPYAVHTARELWKQGFELRNKPVSPEQLCEEVSELCLSKSKA